MKKIALWNNYTNFAKNEAFNPKAYGIGEDLGYPIILLKEKLLEKGVVLETLDMDVLDNYSSIIFIDVPNPRTCCVDLNLIDKERKYLVLSECEMIYHENARKDLLQYYNKVFAYNDDLVKDCNYIKLSIPNKIKMSKTNKFNEKKFSVMIAGNKKSSDFGELYSERLRTIKYMEKKHPEMFDLYGIGGDKLQGPRMIRMFNKLPLLKTLFSRRHKCYRGRIEKKISVLSEYKFCFCYENSRLIPGYISEKIMDCFFSGCVPIYFGAPNVYEYIPDNCFIDFNNFKNYDELYLYLSNMTVETYNMYIENINIFLTSPKVYPFSAECFVETIINEVLK